MEIIQDEASIAEAQDLFRRSFESLPHELIYTSIGYQGGYFQAEVIWVPSLAIWGYFGLPPNEKSPGERFWNPFGVDYPRSQVSIVCEVNPPRRGVNPMTGGVFLRGDRSDRIVAHRGRFTVTGGIPARYFFDRYVGDLLVLQPRRVTLVLARVARLQSADFGPDIARFIKEAHRIKEMRRAENGARRQTQARSA